MHVRVLSWNIHKGIGGIDRRYRPERTLEVIAGFRPDVVFLQEVDEGAPRSGHHRQVDWFGDALGLRHRAYGPNVRLRRGVYGNAILCRWPLGETRNIDLTIGPKKPRGALFCRCRVGGRRTLHLYNLHLGLAGFERSRQLRRFLQSHPFSSSHPRAPVIFGGDLNDLWGSLGPKLLEPAGFRRIGDPVHTYPAIYPVRPLDGLFFRGDLQVEAFHCARGGLAREASDHLPIVADLSLRNLPRKSTRSTPEGVPAHKLHKMGKP
jgi:endonuclease/exonuclease/phosphatase family metal-dependent hydrolase